MDGKLSVLFFCEGNSCRSQMAEGLCLHLKGDCIEPHSAGTVSRELAPLAVAVMREIGVDIFSPRSKTVEDLSERDYDSVVTIFDDTETCPFFPGNAKQVNRGFNDPPKLAAGVASREEALTHYRRVRDEIREFILGFSEALDREAGPFGQAGVAKLGGDGVA